MTETGMRVTTTKCSRFGHPEFVLDADEAQVPSVYLTNFVQTIEGMVASGSVFKPDQTFQIGWGLTLVEQAGEMFSLAEPDMESFPIKWTKGITSTLRQMTLQLFMLDSVGLRQEMDAPSIQQSLIACSRYNEPSFFMSRSHGQGGSDSGWFIDCLADDQDHQDAAGLTCISIYEAFLNQPGIQGFASFPVGSVIASDREQGLKIFKDGTELDIVPGSLLDEWSRKRGF
jgi:hypothetical protein